MRTYDFSPLWRSTIGFDRIFDLLDETQRTVDDHYPPYNIKRLGEDHYQISLALAGFTPDEIAVTAEQNVLTVEGRKDDEQPPSRHFGRTFQAPVRPCRLCAGESGDD
jgi:molecular chaperone IbpA